MWHSCGPHFWPFASFLQARHALNQYKESGLPLGQCSVASDGFGSWPVYNKQGHLLSYEVLLLMSIHVLSVLHIAALAVVNHKHTPGSFWLVHILLQWHCIACWCRSPTTNDCCLIKCQPGTFSIPFCFTQLRLVLPSLQVADLGAIFRFLVSMVKEEGWGLSEVLQFMTSNPARVLQLPHKGQVQPTGTYLSWSCSLVQQFLDRSSVPHAFLPSFWFQTRVHQVMIHAYMQIAAGKDADLLLLDEASLELKYVYCKGVLVKTPEWTRGGMFERGDHIRPIKPVLRS